MLGWVLVEKARHGHMSDEYEDRYMIIVLWQSPYWVSNILESTTVVLTELIKGAQVS